MPGSFPATKASKSPCGRAKARWRFVPAAISRRPVTINSPSGATNSSLCGVPDFSAVLDRRVACRRCEAVLVEEVSWDKVELALYHSLGKLPDPQSTHDFF